MRMLGRQDGKTTLDPRAPPSPLLPSFSTSVGMDKRIQTHSLFKFVFKLI